LRLGIQRISAFSSRDAPASHRRSPSTARVMNPSLPLGGGNQKGFVAAASARTAMAHHVWFQIAGPSPPRSRRGSSRSRDSGDAPTSAAEGHSASSWRSDDTASIMWREGPAATSRWTDRPPLLRSSPPPRSLRRHGAVHDEAAGRDHVPPRPPTTAPCSTGLSRRTSRRSSGSVFPMSRLSGSAASGTLPVVLPYPAPRSPDGSAHSHRARRPRILAPLAASQGLRGPRR
jgi:hypothetical protein